MFRFEQPAYIYIVLLWIAIAVAGYYLLHRRRQEIWASVGNWQLIQRLLPDFSEQRQRLRYVLWAAALVCIGLALANPQLGKQTEKVTRKGIDVVVALDVSKSMLAEDLAPNRLERSKQAIAKMIDSMKDDRLGLVVFAGSAYLQMPLSSDYSAAKMMLQTINTDLMPTQGTAIGEAIDVALQAFDTDSGAATTQASEQLKNKAIVILSDGEDHEEGSDIMARKANEAHVAIYTVGVGTEQGGKIPVVANGRRVDFKRDDNGNEVVSKLDENALRDIAQIGQGSYFSLAAGSSTEIDRLLAALAQFEKREIDDHVFTDYADQFQYFIALALLLVIAELMLPTIRVKT